MWKSEPFTPALDCVQCKGHECAHPIFSENFSDSLLTFLHLLMLIPPSLCNTLAFLLVKSWGFFSYMQINVLLHSSILKCFTSCFWLKQKKYQSPDTYTNCMPLRPQTSFAVAAIIYFRTVASTQNQLLNKDYWQLQSIEIFIIKEIQLKGYAKQKM